MSEFLTDAQRRIMEQPDKDSILSNPGQQTVQELAFSQLTLIPNIGIKVDLPSASSASDLMKKARNMFNVAKGGFSDVNTMDIALDLILHYVPYSIFSEDSTVDLPLLFTSTIFNSIPGARSLTPITTITGNIDLANQKIVFYAAQYLAMTFFRSGVSTKGTIENKLKKAIEYPASVFGCDIRENLPPLYMNDTVFSRVKKQISSTGNTWVKTIGALLRFVVKTKSIENEDKEFFHGALTQAFMGFGDTVFWEYIFVLNKYRIRPRELLQKIGVGELLGPSIVFIRYHDELYDIINSNENKSNLTNPETEDSLTLIRMVDARFHASATMKKMIAMGAFTCAVKIKTTSVDDPDTMMKQRKRIDKVLFNSFFNFGVFFHENNKHRIPVIERNDSAEKRLAKANSHSTPY